MNNLMSAIEGSGFEYVFIVIGAICLLLSIVFVFNVVVDVLKTVFYKLKGQNYEWSTPKIFTETKSWTTCCIISLGILIGICILFSRTHMYYEEKTNPEGYCSECSKELPKEYGIILYDDFFCPMCALQLVETEAYIDRKDIENKIEESIVLDKSECCWCGNPAPSDLVDQGGERYCIDCVSNALQSNNVYSAFIRFLEYGY